jgi:alpha-1,6-mannosyltransferase
MADTMDHMRGRGRPLSTHSGVLALSAPAYAALFFIHLRNSLASLTAGRVPPDLGYGADASPALQFLQILCLGYLFLIYGLTLWNWRRLHANPRFPARSVAAIALMAWSLLPANSSDVLDYIGFGRLAAVYHVSPYLDTYSEFTDHFAPYVTWDDPMPYGPVVLPVFAIAGVIAEHHVLFAIYLIKFAWLIIHVLNAWLIYSIAQSLVPDPGYAAFLFAFNPLILLEQIGNAHNDGLLILFGLLAMLALQRSRDALAVPLALLSALVKMSGVFWFAAVVALLIRHRRWQSLVRGIGSSLAGLAILFMFVPGFASLLTVMKTQAQYSEDSLHTLLIDRAAALGRLLNGTWGYDEFFRTDRLIFSVLFIGVCLWRFTLIRDLVSLIRQLGCLLLVLLLGYAASVYPWYTAWLLPIAALTDSAQLRRTIVVFSAASLALYAFPYSLLDEPSGVSVWLTVRLGLAFIVPIAWWMWEGIRTPQYFASPSRLGAAQSSTLTRNRMPLGPFGDTR